MITVKQIKTETTYESIFVATMDNFQGVMLCLTLIIGASGFHNNAIAVNPSDLAPKHSGSVFGLMNTVGAIPGTFYS